jgi:hypothetical protein
VAKNFKSFWLAFGLQHLAFRGSQQPAQREQLTNHASYQGPFLAQNQGHFAEKRGSRPKYFALFFAFFRFCGILSATSYCVATRSGDPTPPKKIVPKTLP